MLILKKREKKNVKDSKSNGATAPKLGIIKYSRNSREEADIASK
jgi:hypothetical protein